jgi:hypothetical protein
MAGAIFLIARLLPDQHDARAARAFAEHGLRGLEEKRATTASGRGAPQTGQRTPRRKKRLRRRQWMVVCA